MTEARGVADENYLLQHYCFDDGLRRGINCAHTRICGMVSLGLRCTWGYPWDRGLLRRRTRDVRARGSNSKNDQLVELTAMERLANHLVEMNAGPEVLRCTSSFASNFAAT